jgi:hypothetical protein
VEEQATRLRFFITSDHTEAQIRETVQAVADELEKIDPQYLMRPVPGNGHSVSKPSVAPVR